MHPFGILFSYCILSDDTLGIDNEAGHDADLDVMGVEVITTESRFSYWNNS